MFFLYWSAQNCTHWRTWQQKVLRAVSKISMCFFGYESWELWNPNSVLCCPSPGTACTSLPHQLHQGCILNTNIGNDKLWGPRSGHCSTRAVHVHGCHDLTAFIRQQLECGTQRVCPVHPARPATWQLDGRRCPPSTRSRLLYVLHLPKGEPKLTQASRVTLEAVSTAMHILWLSQHDWYQVKGAATKKTSL